MFNVHQGMKPTSGESVAMVTTLTSLSLAVTLQDQQTWQEPQSSGPACKKPRSYLQACLPQLSVLLCQDQQQRNAAWI